jgi:Protein of unknown function (DUF2891)
MAQDISTITHGATALTAEMASLFSEIVLSNVTREYPNKMDHVMIDAADIKGPRALHPLFYGSFDWHSCVHSYWLLSRVHRLFPGIAGIGNHSLPHRSAFYREQRGR